MFRFVIGVSFIWLAAGTGPRQETRPDPAEVRRRRLLAEVDPVGEAPMRAVLLWASLGGEEREIYLQWPDRMRIVDPGADKGPAAIAKRSIVVMGSRATRLREGGAREEVAGAELTEVLAQRNAIAAALLWPLHDVSSASLEKDGVLRVKSRSGLEHAVRAPEGTRGEIEVRSGAAVTRLSSWLVIDGVRFPGNVEHQDGALRVHVKSSRIKTQWKFDPSFFDPDAEKRESEKRPMKAPGAPQDPRSFSEPKVDDSPAADWLVYPDPGDWVARRRFLNRLVPDLVAAGRLAAAMPVYFSDASGPVVAIPVEADPAREQHPLPEPFKGHLIKKPAERIVTLDVRGDPAEAGSVLPRIVRFCRDQGLTPGNTRFIPSLGPADRMPASLEGLSTRVEVVIRP